MLFHDTSCLGSRRERNEANAESLPDPEDTLADPTPEAKQTRSVISYHEADADMSVAFNNLCLQPQINQFSFEVGSDARKKVNTRRSQSPGLEY